MLMKMRRLSVLALLCAASLLLACGDDADANNDGDDNNTEEQTEELTCEDEEWADFAADTCEECPAVDELNCEIFDFFENGDHDSRWIAEDEELRIHLNPGMVEITEADAVVYVREDSTHMTQGERHEPAADIDENTLVFDLSGLLEEGKRLDFEELTVADACGEEYTGEFMVSFYPNADAEFGEADCEVSPDPGGNNGGTGGGGG